jgi:septum formation protein
MTDLILASGSRARRQMLEAAGLTFEVRPTDVDEDAIRATLGDATPQHVAVVLARAKAEAASREVPDALVIGADQVLALGRTIYTKAPDIAAARSALRSLAGRSHHLHSAVTLALAGCQVWHHLDTAALAMRDFSDAFLDEYLARAGDRVCASVGAYELEGLGIQLFERIEGDYFTILGMPLLPLLSELRARGTLPA